MPERNVTTATEHYQSIVLHAKNSSVMGMAAMKLFGTTDTQEIFVKKPKIMNVIFAIGTQLIAVLETAPRSRLRMQHDLVRFS